MIFLKRRRLIIWLFKAYIKKWRRTIFISFLLGLIVFFILRFGVNYFIPLIPFTQQETIGLVGAYTAENLPPEIVEKISKGLTHVDSNAGIKPSIAKSWEIKNDGKKYIFHLKDNVYFNDGTKLTSDQINYNFLDVSVERPDAYTIVFNLKNSYSPFLITVSRPVFKKGFVGTGEYRVQAINLNGDFVQSIDLVSTKSDNRGISYQFYPTEESLKTAFVLGDASKIIRVKDTGFQNKDLISFPNAIVTKNIDYSQLVTLFYNTQNSNLSDKRLRQALSYAVSDSFPYGERNYGSFAPKSWVSRDGLTSYQQDFQHAKLLLSETPGATKSASITLDLKTLPQYKKLASQIQMTWEKIGINTKITVVDYLPSTFEVFLGDFTVPKDPDQYSIWHSSHENNITKYKNLRIDKLLEDGRQTVDINERRKIYSDFQKYLLDDPPATFLYFPYVYEITRR